MWAHPDHKITFACGLGPVKTSLGCKERSFEDIEISNFLAMWGRLGGGGLSRPPRPHAFYQHCVCHGRTVFKK